MTRIAPLLLARLRHRPRPRAAAPEAPAAPSPLPPSLPCSPGTGRPTADMSADKEVIAAADLLANPASYVDDIRVEGRVADVCQKMGCWMVVSEGDQSIRHHEGPRLQRGQAGRGHHLPDRRHPVPAADPETIAHFEGEATEGAVIPEQQVEGDVAELVASGVRMKPTG